MRLSKWGYATPCSDRNKAYCCRAAGQMPEYRWGVCGEEKSTEVELTWAGGKCSYIGVAGSSSTVTRTKSGGRASWNGAASLATASTTSAGSATEWPCVGEAERNESGDGLLFVAGLIWPAAANVSGPQRGEGDTCGRFSDTRQRRPYSCPCPLFPNPHQYIDRRKHSM